MQNDSQRGKMAQIKWIKVHKSQYLNIFPAIYGIVNIDRKVGPLRKVMNKQDIVNLYRMILQLKLMNICIRTHLPKI